MNPRTEFEEFLIEKCNHLETELKVTREEIFELDANLIYYRQFYFWAKNRLEEEGILLTENGVKKPNQMTKNELIARNQLVIRKQENKVSDKPCDLHPMPAYEELLKQYEENVPKIDPVAKAMIRELERELKQAYFTKASGLNLEKANLFLTKDYFDLPLEKIEEFVKSLEISVQA